MASPNDDQKTILVTGAAGFIGSHLVDRLLGLGYRVVGVDNLVRGRIENLAEARHKGAFRFVELDLSRPFEANSDLADALGSGQLSSIWHLAANSDIAAGVADPDVDLRDTFMTTFQVLRFAKARKVPDFFFASSSAIYGEHASALRENTGPAFPISNYGAMKLASEGAITAALESYLSRAWIFRFPNVVGGRATHGALYDFVQRLKKDPSKLVVLGDGTQEKPYLHVSELVDAMLMAAERSPDKLSFYNIGQEATRSTVRYIAETAVRIVSSGAKLEYTGGSKGWVGDVPKFSLSIEKIGTLGWKPKMTSDATVERSLREIARDSGYSV